MGTQQVMGTSGNNEIYAQLIPPDRPRLRRFPTLGSAWHHTHKSTYALRRCSKWARSVALSKLSLMKRRRSESGMGARRTTAAAPDSTVDIKLRIKLHSVKDGEVAVWSPMVKVTVSLSPGSRASDEKH